MHRHCGVLYTDFFRISKAGVVESRTVPSMLWYSFRYASRRSGTNTDYDLPRTPEGKNPYDVFNIDVVTSTEKSIAKRYKQLVINNHPDRPGGSTTKMQEINEANNILRRHHKRYQEAVIRGKSQHPSQKGDSFEYEQRRDFHKEKIRTTGGVPGASNHMGPTVPWKKYKQRKTHAVGVMINRYAFACKQGLWMRKHRNLVQLIARERWLIQGFISNLRSEAQERKRHIEQTKKAAQVEIDEFHKDIEEALNSAFAMTTKAAERKMKIQKISVAIRICLLLIAMLVVYDRLYINPFIRNSFGRMYKDAI